MTWWGWLLVGIGLGMLVGSKLQREAWIYFGLARRPDLRHPETIDDFRRRP